MNKTTTRIVIPLAIALGVGLGYWMGGNFSSLEQSGSAADSGERKVLFWRNPMNPAITSTVFMQDEMGMDYLPVYADEDKPKEKEVLFWRNPMNPAITSPVFMQDEMGMDYLPVYADNTDGDESAGTVKIDPVTVQNIGVRTAMVEQRKLTRELNALGRVDFNEERLTRLHPKTSGWIEEMFFDQTGASIKKGSMLLSVYSPDLVAAQQEYLIALKNREDIGSSANAAMKKSAQTILASARERLQLYDVPDHQIKELEQTRKLKKKLHIHSPFKGQIMHIGAREGQYVTPKDELYLIADLKRIWVYVDVYEDELPWINLGDEAQMRVRAVPGRVYEGKVTFIYPTLTGKTRTVRVRLEFDNADLSLKPGMFANVILKVDPQDNAVVVPSEAIVRSGSREQIFVVRAPGKFEPREVRLGFSSAGMTQILQGVSAGEEVVVSSQFLIDSESKLREATAKMMAAMSGTEEVSTADMDMGDMSMNDMEMDMGDMSMDDVQGSTSAAGDRMSGAADMSMDEIKPDEHKH